MAELVVLGFKDTTAADEAIGMLEEMHRENLIVLADWARLIRREDGKTEVRQAVNTAATGATGGAFWGILFGMLFLMPLAGAAVGAAVGALWGALSDLGIDDRFIKDVGHQIEPGTSALFLYVAPATTDRVVECMKTYQPEVLRTSLSTDSRDTLRQALQAA
jgi:uncharacterized membrane protein